MASKLKIGCVLLVGGSAVGACGGSVGVPLDGPDAAGGSGGYASDGTYGTGGYQTGTGGAPPGFVGLPGFGTGGQAPGTGGTFCCEGSGGQINDGGFGGLGGADP